MPKFIKDYLSPIVCVLTLIAGMAYASGQQEQRIRALEQRFVDLNGSMISLQQTVAALNQELKDERLERSRR